MRFISPSTGQCQTNPRLTDAVKWRCIDKIDPLIDSASNCRNCFLFSRGKTQKPATQSKRLRFHLCASQSPNFQIWHS